MSLIRRSTSGKHHVRPGSFFDGFGGLASCPASPLSLAARSYISINRTLRSSRVPPALANVRASDKTFGGVSAEPWSNQGAGCTLHRFTTIWWSQTYQVQCSVAS